MNSNSIDHTISQGCHRSQGKPDMTKIVHQSCLLGKNKTPKITYVRFILFPIKNK